MGFITTQNKGREIVDTNYFGSEMEQRGYIFMSSNAGSFRLLLPSSLNHTLPDIKTGKYAVISRGPIPEGGKHDGVEIMFEDHSDDPYSFVISPEQYDWMAGNADNNYEFVLDVWTAAGHQLSMPCYFRTVNKLPCLKPFPTHKAKQRYSPYNELTTETETQRSMSQQDIFRGEILYALRGAHNKFMKYHSELPEELNRWYCYLTDCGHSILAILSEFEDEAFNEDGKEGNYLCPTPAKAVLESYRVRDGYIVVDNPNLAYDKTLGLLSPERYDEF